MSNFSSIGVSVYEITHDCRATWPYRVSGDPVLSTAGILAVDGGQQRSSEYRRP
jgi:hypothetical protein